MREELSATLLQWNVEDFAFREIVYAMLCIAAGGQYLSTIDDKHVKQNIVYAFSYKQPIMKDKHEVKRAIGTDVVAASPHMQSDSFSEFLSLFLSGNHLAGMKKGLSPDDTTYWFNGALIILTTRLKSPYALERGLHQILQYRHQHQCKTFNAVLISIEHVVLVKVFPNGEIEHTDVMALFRIERHISAGVQGTSSTVLEENPQAEKPRSPRDEMPYHARESKEHNEQMSTDAARRAQHPGTTSSTNRTFQALTSFFDAVTLEQMGATEYSQGRFPNEIYTRIMHYVLDAPTRHACIQVSPIFREICLQNYSIGNNTLLLPSGFCKQCVDSDVTSEWLLARDSRTGIETRVAILGEDDCTGFSARRWSRESQMRALVGSEFNRKSLLPFTLRFWSLIEDKGDGVEEFELKTRAGDLGWELKPRRRRMR